MIKNLLNTIGLDKSIAYLSSARIVSAVGNIISAIFIVKFLTKEEMGFYYTFNSILALQIFFELGLNGILTQYVAHEASHLAWDSDRLVGEERYRSRLASLLRFTVKWYLVIAILVFAFLNVVGFSFFNIYDKTGGEVSWQTAWISLAIATSCNLFFAPLFSILEGLGKVKEVARYRFFQQLFSFLIVWISFFLGAKLMVAAVNAIAWGVVSVVALSCTSFGPILKNIWQEKVTERVLYKEEIFPYQWKMALSTVSGYFIFQLFNPVLFATEGAVVAGQMGLTLSALNAIQALSVSWTSTKIPCYSGLIELKKYKELDALFFRTTNQAAFVNGSCLIVLFLVVFAIRNWHIEIFSVYFGDRFLDYSPMLLMAVPVFAQQYINAWATYLRCHKQEPFFINSVVVGILCCLSTVMGGKLFGLMGITGGYCFLQSVLGLIWAYLIFKKKRIAWHMQ